MTSAYPDIEGQLYADGKVDASYTEAEARQRAATLREQRAAYEASAQAAEASARAALAAQTATSEQVSAWMATAEQRITGIEAMAGVSAGSVTDGQTAALIASPTSQTRAALNSATEPLRAALDGATEPLRARLTVLESRTPEHVGAAGDGVTDDTAALSEWVSAGGGTLPPRTYRLTGGIQASRDDVHIDGHGGVLAADGRDGIESRILTITGNRAHISGVTLRPATGRARHRGGLYLMGDDHRVIGCHIEGLRSENESRGIHVAGQGSVVMGNRIHNIYATGNGVEGDGTGMSRGIVVHNTSPATSPTLVHGNHITDILGEEGDGIAVLASPGDGTGYISSLTAISDNLIDNCSRRCIKVQAWDVTVSGNKLFDTDRKMYGNEASLINTYSSGRLVIDQNVLWPSDLTGTISVDGAVVSGVASVPDVTIRGNTVHAEKGAASLGIYAKAIDGLVVQGNDVTGGGKGISVSFITRGAITGNVTRDLTPGTNVTSVHATSSCKNVAITNNIDLSPGVYRPFRNDASTGAILENNHAMTA